MKKVNRITESQLKQMICESVKKVLNELSYNLLSRAAQKETGNRKYDFLNAAKNSWNREYGVGVNPKYGGQRDVDDVDREGGKPYMKMVTNYPGYCEIESGDGSGYGEWIAINGDDNRAYPETYHYYTPIDDNPQGKELVKARRAADSHGKLYSGGGRRSAVDNTFR